MQGAFASVNFLGGNTYVKKYCLYMALSFMIFVVWDTKQKDELGKGFKTTIIFEVILVVLYLWIATRERPGFLLPAIVSIVAALIMAFIFLTAYKSKGAKEINLASNAQTITDKLIPLPVALVISIEKLSVPPQIHHSSAKKRPSHKKHKDN